MIAYVFGACLVISIILLIVMASRNYTNMDATFWSLFILIPVVLLGYTLKAQAKSVEDARLAFYFIYIDSTILLMMLLFAMIKSLGLKPKAWVKVLCYSISFLHLGSIWYGMGNDLYYADFKIYKTPMGTVTKMVSGPMKITHYIYLAAIVVAMIVVLCYCARRKKDASKLAMMSYATVGLFGMVFYVVEMVAGFDFSVLPYLYTIADIFIVLQYEKTHSHDIDSVVVDLKKEASGRGYVALDMSGRLLCYNNNAIFYVPELEGRRIDSKFQMGQDVLADIFYPLMEDIEKNGRASRDYNHEDITYRCTANLFYMHEGGKPRGYLFEIQDITAEQGYMNLIKQYGESLQKDVTDKTTHIQFIQERVVLGMATIIENRDLNTGGHVKRTSDVIRILVEEMQRMGIGDLDETYADQIVRSAPMHDLGKIAIDNAILNKPGRLTDEEFAIMKTHSARSGEIVQAILVGVEEAAFVNTAYCLARFHHERWDGKGYPERLMGVEIPLEARIMAVADVYDALVSKRCYKEPMSFEQAADIMLEGMGSQFDPMMKDVFINCRPKLEAYYAKHREE